MKRLDSDIKSSIKPCKINVDVTLRCLTLAVGGCYSRRVPWMHSQLHRIRPLGCPNPLEAGQSYLSIQASSPFNSGSLRVFKTRGVCVRNQCPSKKPTTIRLPKRKKPLLPSSPKFSKLNSRLRNPLSSPNPSKLQIPFLIRLRRLHPQRRAPKKNPAWKILPPL